MSHLLGTPKEIKGLELIASLARTPEMERLDIFTLNHDLLVEGLFAEKGLPLIDGFGKAKGDLRRFEPELYETASKARLFKLHGSINWHRFRGKAWKETDEAYAIPVKPDVNHCRDEEGNLYHVPDTAPLFLTGTFNKITRYNVGLFAEMHWWFHKMLKEHDTIAMSGYGWNDSAINVRLMEWLLKTSKHRLYLMHARQEEIARKIQGGMWFRYEKLVEEKRIMPITKWMQEVTIEELMGRIAEGGVVGKHE